MTRGVSVHLDVGRRIKKIHARQTKSYKHTRHTYYTSKQSNNSCQAEEMFTTVEAHQCVAIIMTFFALLQSFGSYWVIPGRVLTLPPKEETCTKYMIPKSEPPYGASLPLAAHWLETVVHQSIVQFQNYPFGKV